MPSTTPLRNLPFPVDADARGAGAQAMEDLALAVEAELEAEDNRHRQAFAIASPGGGVALGANTSGMCPWDAANSWDFSPEFVIDDAANTVTYGGPARWFLVSAGAVFTAAGVSGDNTWTANLLNQSTPIQGVTRSVGLINDDETTAQHTLAITVPVLLALGAALQLQVATGGRAANVGGQWMRVAPLGPVV